MTDMNASRNTQNPTIILGAGIAGLRAAQQLAENKKIILLEKRKHIGGLATSFKYKTLVYGIGPDKIYSILPGIMKEYKDILEQDCITVTKKNSLHLAGHSYKFPIKPFEIATNFSPFTAVNCALSYATTFLHKKPQDYLLSYEDYFLNGFGKAAYEFIFKDIANKVWGDPKKLSADLAERRIPVPSILKMAQQLFTKNVKPEVSASHFYYPKNAMITVSETMMRQIRQNRGLLHLETAPSAIEVKDSKVVLVAYKSKEGETKITPEDVISTIHLIDLIGIIKPTPPAEVLDAVKKLKYRSLIIVYIILKKQKAMDDQWVFFPQKDYIFTRVAEQKNFSQFSAPEDKTALTAEVGCEFEDETYKLSDKEIYEKVIIDLEKAGITKKEEVEEYFTVKINRCYPVYEIGYKENLAKVLDYIDGIKNLYTIGRQGLFNYNNTDHSIDMANKLAYHILWKKPKEEWKQARQSFDEYRIVD